MRFLPGIMSLRGKLYGSLKNRDREFDAARSSGL
jgi:hypothetical protein